MSDDPLEQAQTLNQLRETLTVNLIAGGALPSTAAARQGVPFDVGHLVRDTVTGQYGVIQHVSRQEVIRPASKP